MMMVLFFFVDVRTVAIEGDMREACMRNTQGKKKVHADVREEKDLSRTPFSRLLSICTVAIQGKVGKHLTTEGFDGEQRCRGRVRRGEGGGHERSRCTQHGATSHGSHMYGTHPFTTSSSSTPSCLSFRFFSTEKTNTQTHTNARVLRFLLFGGQ
jgi:hypothetical protein